MKSEAQREGLWRRVAHVWVYNSRGKILLQLRAKTKNTFPNRWDLSVAGHISAGEEPLVSALREIEEEIGLSAKKEDLEFFKIIKYQDVFHNVKINNFIYVYTYWFDGDINNLKVQEEEVQGIQFIPMAEIEKGLKTHPEKYTPNQDNYWFDSINEIKQRLNL